MTQSAANPRRNRPYGMCVHQRFTISVVVLVTFASFAEMVTVVGDFGRVLAYVWVHQPDGSEVMANAEMLWLGHARVQNRSPNAKYDSYFRDLQTKARDQGLGLWSSEAGRVWASRR